MEKLETVLNKQEIQYEIFKHDKRIHSAQEGAEYFGIEIGQTAPTLILKTDKGYYSLILSGDYGRVDFEVIKNLLHFEEIKLAKPHEVEQVTGCKIGDVSLVNPELPTILDKGLYRFPYIYGGAGVPQTTLKIQPQDLEKLNSVVEFLR